MKAFIGRNLVVIGLLLLLLFSACDDDGSSSDSDLCSSDYDVELYSISRVTC